MNLYRQARESTYRAQRTASHGATITLVLGCGELTATFDCASRCASVLGSRGFTDEEGVPAYTIPMEDAHSALTKLSAQHSVALVDTVLDDFGSRYVLVWKISPAAKAKVVIPVDREPASTNLDEY